MYYRLLECPLTQSIVEAITPRGVIESTTLGAAMSPITQLHHKIAGIIFLLVSQVTTVITVGYVLPNMAKFLK